MKAVMVCIIWLAVAVVGWKTPEAGVAIAIFAMITTIVLHSD